MFGFFLADVLPKNLNDKLKLIMIYFHSLSKNVSNVEYILLRQNLLLDLYQLNIQKNYHETIKK